MKKVKYYVALVTGKCIYIVLRILGRKATNLPGDIACKICPNFLEYVKKTPITVAVTGTNGKTTTSNMICDMFRLDGKKVLNNSFGSNISSGIASLYISNFSKKDVTVLEIDERASYQIFPYIPINYLIVTNLFRDSLKRNAHVEYIYNYLNNSIRKDYKLILNADDIISSTLGKTNKRIYFSIDKLQTDKKECTSIINDCIYCPYCGKKLEYEYHRYHHLGKASCSNCGFKNFDPSFILTNIAESDIIINDISYPKINDSIFNIYNELAVISLFKSLDYLDKNIIELLKQVKITDLRMEKFKVQDKEIIRHVAKGQNPVACSRVFDFIKNYEGKKQLIIMNDDISDNKYSTESICWLYETDFEYLNDESITNIIFAGPRCLDNKVRGLLAKIDESKIKTSFNELDSYELINYDCLDKIFVVHDVYNNHYADKVVKSILKKLGEK